MSGRSLTDADVQALADALSASLRTPAMELVGTAQVAEALSVSQAWVREHAVELGAIRVGDGKRGELRFEMVVVRRAMERRRLRAAPVAEVTPIRRPGRPRKVRDGVDLLPYPDWSQSA